MSSWYRKLRAAPEDYALVLAAFDHFEAQADEAQAEFRPHGILLEELQKRLPGQIAYRTNQQQELAAILEHLEGLEARALTKHMKLFLETYNRTLTPTLAERYAKNDPEVILLGELCTHIRLLKSRFDGIWKALNAMHYQLTNVTKLRVAGLEDAIY